MIVVVISVSNIIFSILSWTARVSFLWQEEPGEGDQVKCINRLWISSKDITNITTVIILFVKRYRQCSKYSGTYQLLHHVTSSLCSGVSGRGAPWVSGKKRERSPLVWGKENERFRSFFKKRESSPLVWGNQNASLIRSDVEHWDGWLYVKFAMKIEVCFCFEIQKLICENKAQGLNKWDSPEKIQQRGQQESLVRSQPEWW